jgi:hypothetical protein
MPDWLQQAITDEAPLGLMSLILNLGLAFLLGCLVAGIHALTTRSASRGPQRSFLATLVLLSVLIAMVTLVIGNNVARAFSLVGALAIVRFRTVVADTRDTAFVIFAVVVGMASGAGYRLIPIVGMPLVLVAAWLFRPSRGSRREREAILVLRLGVAHTQYEGIKDILQRHVASFRLTGLATARGGAALDVTYSIHPNSPESAMALVTELTRLEGVQGVELKEA